MMMTTRNIDRLRHNVLTEVLTDEQFASLRGQLTEHRFGTGEIILEDESEGGELHLIVEGRVRITKASRHGPETLLALLHPGDFFGELELIDGRPRAARVAAVDETTTFTLSREAFAALLTQSNELALRLLQVLSVRLRSVDNHFVREMERTNDQSTGEVKRLRRIIEAAKSLNSTLDLDRLLDVILETALGLVDGDRGTVYLVDPERHELWSRALKGDRHIDIRLPQGMGIAGYVAATGDTLNIPDAYYDPRFNPDIDRISGYRTQSILCMPMKNKEGTIIGVFQLLNKRTGTFTEEDEEILDALSVHAAIAIENARLHEQERQKIALEKDIHAAREVQMTLLPKQVPKVPGFDFAAATIPAREVGGDLYDFLAVDDRHLVFCLGDVSGKGLAASLLMANIQATLRDQALSTRSAAECVRRSNALLHASTGSEKFVTLFYAVLDPVSGAVAYCNAGHERPFTVSHDGTTRRLATGGIILGILEEFPFEEETIILAPGETLVVFSDGISEAVNSADEQFGELRIEAVLQGCRRLPAVEIRDALIAAVRAHAGNAPQADDITVVIVQRTK